MSFTWRYLVRPDGDFCRIANLDGSLDDVSDEELARLYPSDREEDQPARPCSRCGGELLLHWNGPLMTRVWMELCAACDAHRPAARSFIRWYRDADRDPKALPQLFEDWETETMCTPTAGPEHLSSRLRKARLPHPVSLRADGAERSPLETPAAVARFGSSLGSATVRGSLRRTGQMGSPW
ncbi:DUF6300 family protein [Streptomyces canus]|uniref:DUF6300 family protein n=1 Tax=Streptomyces canus TaxID=58343 RepID=UPI0033A5BADD